MVPNIPILTLGVVATVVLAANRFATALGAYPTAGGAIHGVTRTPGEIGDRVPLDVLGTTEVETGGVVTAGAHLMVDNQGRVLDHTGSNVKVGRAGQFSSADGAGKFIEVFILQNG